jgi:cobyrinic acid a,c-diamide synthase
MESVAATALGFREYATQTSHEIDVTGVIAAQAHGGRHEQGIRQALPDSPSYLGRVPPLDGLSIPERHLGLHLGSESPVDPEALDTAAQTIRGEQLLDLAREPPDSMASPICSRARSTSRLNRLYSSLVISSIVGGSQLVMRRAH